MNLPVGDKTPQHTYGEYLTWTDEQRYELIDGVAYAMTPSPSRTHQRIVGELFRQIANALEQGPCEVNIAPLDVRFPAEGDSDADTATVLQPDIFVVCDPEKLDEHGCRGAPDWVIEVISPQSASHDQITKLATYERHGVREYWLVHPIDRIVFVYRLEGACYGRPSVHELKGTLSSASVPGTTIDWDRAVRHLP
jgi:Uma2 family endonuclease